MSRIFLLLFVLMTVFTKAQNNDSVFIRKLFNEALTNSSCYQNLYDMCTQIGPRLSGSEQAQKSVTFIEQAMKQTNADKVYLQECMVPHWVRGKKEEAFSIDNNNKKLKLNICALGGSIGTPTKGLTAEVIVANSFDELKTFGKEKVEGKIVFFNYPFDDTKIHVFEAYGKAAKYRVWGASEAAKYGAIAVIVRSMTTLKEDLPHTGVMLYKDSIAKIPACAVSTNDADKLASMDKAKTLKKVFIKMNCETLPDVPSNNVVAEIKGSEKPDEIITIGGHLDSWDLGQGAHDDGAGVVQSIAVIELFKKLGYQPKRTIRAVAFMNEENGKRGGLKYGELAKQNNEKHIFALESDRGGFVPQGFSFTMPAEKKQKIVAWKKLFEPYGLHDFSREGGGVDIEPLEEQGVPVGELLPDSQRYFDVHHSANDNISQVNKRELELGAASIAALIYLISEYGL